MDSYYISVLLKARRFVAAEHYADPLPHKLGPDALVESMEKQFKRECITPLSLLYYLHRALELSSNPFYRGWYHKRIKVIRQRMEYIYKQSLQNASRIM